MVGTMVGTIRTIIGITLIAMAGTGIGTTHTIGVGDIRIITTTILIDHLTIRRITDLLTTTLHTQGRVV